MGSDAALCNQASLAGRLYTQPVHVVGASSTTRSSRVADQERVGAATVQKGATGHEHGSPYCDRSRSGRSDPQAPGWEAHSLEGRWDDLESRIACWVSGQQTQSLVSTEATLQDPCSGVDALDLEAVAEQLLSSSPGSSPALRGAMVVQKAAAFGFGEKARCSEEHPSAFRHRNGFWPREAGAGEGSETSMQAEGGEADEEEWLQLLEGARPRRGIFRWPLDVLSFGQERKKVEAEDGKAEEEWLQMLADARPRCRVPRPPVDVYGVSQELTQASFASQAPDEGSNLSSYRGPSSDERSHEDQSSAGRSFSCGLPDDHDMHEEARQPAQASHVRLQDPPAHDPDVRNLQKLLWVRRHRNRLGPREASQVPEGGGQRMQCSTPAKQLQACGLTERENWAQKPEDAPPRRSIFRWPLDVFTAGQDLKKARSAFQTHRGQLYVPHSGNS